MCPIYYSQLNLPNVTEAGTIEGKVAEPDKVVKESVVSKVHIGELIQQETAVEEPKKKKKHQKSSKSTSKSKQVISKVHISKPLQQKTAEGEPKKKKRRQNSSKSTSKSEQPRSSTPQLDDTQKNNCQDPTDHITKKRSASQVLRTFHEVQISIPEGDGFEPIGLFDWPT